MIVLWTSIAISDYKVALNKEQKRAKLLGHLQLTGSEAGGEEVAVARAPAEGGGVAASRPLEAELPQRQQGAFISASKSSIRSKS